MTRPDISAGDSEPTLLPNLRFPEFSNLSGWKKRQLSYLLSEPKRRNRDLKFGTKDVLSVSGEFGCVNQIALLGRSYAGASVENYHVVETGDVVYTKSPLKRNPYGIIKANKGRAGIVSTLYAVYRPTIKAHADYLDYYFARDYHLNSYLQPLVRKGPKNDMKVNNSDVLTGEVWVPEVAEQQKIAECLSTLDELIGAESQKLDALKTHKKGLMQQLFPREGETLPRLRFPEFHSSPKWEPKPLFSEIDLISGMHLSPDQYSTSGEVPYFTGPSDFTNDIKTTTKWTKRSANMAAPDDTLITVKGSGVGEVWYSMLPAVAMGRQLMAIRVKAGSSRFMFQFLLTKKTKFEDLGSGNLIPGLSRTDILEMEAHFPSLAEQHRIASCLTSIDDRISAQSDRITALQTHKQGLLQQLFPAPAETKG